MGGRGRLLSQAGRRSCLLSWAPGAQGESPGPPNPPGVGPASSGQAQPGEEKALPSQTAGSLCPVGGGGLSPEQGSAHSGSERGWQGPGTPSPAFHRLPSGAGRGEASAAPGGPWSHHQVWSFVQAKWDPRSFLMGPQAASRLAVTARGPFAMGHLWIPPQPAPSPPGVTERGEAVRPGDVPSCSSGLRGGTRGAHVCPDESRRSPPLERCRQAWALLAGGMGGT